MSDFFARWERLDVKITQFLARYGILFMRIGLGSIFFWFGVLKFFPGLSPAQTLIEQTFEYLTVGIIAGNTGVMLLALWECMIGIGLILGRWLRTTILLLLMQMAGTMLPIVLFPHQCFTYFPLAPTLQGQYIIMNIVLVTAGLVIGATVRGGYIESNNVVKYNVLCFYPSSRTLYSLGYDESRPAARPQVATSSYEQQPQPAQQGGELAKQVGQ